MCRDTWKVIRSLQLLIPYRMRPYSSAKGLCGLSYTFFTGTQLLGQFGETGPPQRPSCTGIPIVCPLLRLGGVLEFWIFWFFGEVKIFLISEGEGGIFIWGRSVHSPSILLKTQRILPVAPSFSIFTLSDWRYMQGFKEDIDFSTESKFSCWRSSFLSCLSGHSEPTKPETTFFFNDLVHLEGPPNHLVSKARTFCVNVNKHDSS